VWVPSGRAVNPITGTNWEGTGVRPDLSVPAADALRAAHLRALERLLRDQRDQERQAALRQIIDQVRGSPAAS
jgi:C-terminal processing protease CtpA/Prc